MTAEELGRSLGARRSGGVWFARCPAHNDRTPSLAITDGKVGVLIRCHGGCPQERVIDALKRRGLWEGRARSADPSAHRAPTVERPAVDPHDAERTASRIEKARRIWESSQPAAGTFAETYLRSRRIIMPPPECLRFHPRLEYWDQETRTVTGFWPAMVAMVQRGTDGEAMAVHRTWLARDGTGKAHVEPAKMMLGPTRGGAVRLAPAADLVMIGEGIETCLAAMQATGMPAWAALSTSGLRALDLPPEIRTAIVLADADEAGEAAAREAAARWAAEGRNVRIARPPKGAKDFNDALA